MPQEAGEHRYRALAGTILTTGLAYVLSYGISLVLTPYITENVGTEAYGFVSLARQFAQYAKIFTMALNSFAATYITLYYHRDDKKTANQYFSSVFFGNLVLTGILQGVALLIIGFLDRLLNIPASLVSDVKLLFLFVFLSFDLQTIFSTYECSAYITDKLDLVGIFKAVSVAAEALCLLVLYAVFPDNVCYVGIGLIVSALVVGLSNRWITRKFTPDLVIRRADCRSGPLKRLLSHGIWNSINYLGDFLNSGLDLLVCNLLLTPLAMGQLAIAKTISSIFAGVLQIMGQAFQPMMLKSYAAKDDQRFMGELSLSMKISGMSVSVLFAGFVALGLPYYRLWIPGEDIQLIFGLTVVTVLVHVAAGPMKPLYYIYNLTEKIILPSVLTIVGGFLNVASMYVLIRYAGMGIYVVAWTTTVIMSFFDLVTNPLYMAHVLKKPWYTFYPNIFKNLIGCGAVTLLFLLFDRAVDPKTWGSFILCAALYAVAGCLFYLFLVLTGKEKRTLLEKLRAQVHRSR